MRCRQTVVKRRTAYRLVWEVLQAPDVQGDLLPVIIWGKRHNSITNIKTDGETDRQTDKELLFDALTAKLIPFAVTPSDDDTGIVHVVIRSSVAVKPSANRRSTLLNAMNNSMILSPAPALGFRVRQPAPSVYIQLVMTSTSVKHALELNGAVSEQWSERCPDRRWRRFFTSRICSATSKALSMWQIKARHFWVVGPPYYAPI